MGKGASLRQVTEAWSRARVVSFYGHGEHIQMGGAAEQVGPQLLLGTGELLGMRSLQWSTFGIERAELWACRTGIDVPWDPAFPMGDGFGFDYELIRSGVRSTVGTLWSVDELATSLIVLRYRTAVAQGRHAAGALADAQRWWRDISGPAIRNSDRVVDTICQLWRDILGRDPGENERGIRAFLSAKQSDGKKWKALMTSLTSPIAHAAYRFCGLIHEPVGVPALRLPHQPDRASAKEIQRIDLRELERFPIIRRSDSVTTEVDAFYDEATDALGLVVHDNFDGDFGYIVLARESRDAPFRFVDGDASFPEQALAEAALVDAIRSRRSDPTVVRALAER